MTPSMPWFRMFSESRMDPKLDALNDREFRIWHKLLCLASESEPRGTVDYLDPEFVAMNLRVGVDELDSAISRMVRLRLVERSDAAVTFPAFIARQYTKPSDMPEAVKVRVRRHRAKVKEERNGVTSRFVTPTEQNRTDSVLGEGSDNASPLTEQEAAKHIAHIRHELARRSA